MRQEVLRAEKLRKTDHGIVKLNGFDLSIYTGEIIGIAGLNGSGRSTIANILSGLISDYKGEIYIDENPIKMRSVKHAQKAGIYCVRHKSTLIPELSIIENMCLTIRNFQNNFIFPTKKQHKSAKNCLRELDIAIDSNNKVKSLTLAQKHIIEIARAFYTGLHVLLLDDIGRDYSEVEYLKFEQLLKILKKKGVSILLIESRLPHLTVNTERMIVIRNGMDVATLYPPSYEINRIQRLMTGEEIITIPNDNEYDNKPDEKNKVFYTSNISTNNIYDLNIYVKKGEVVGFVSKENISCQEIVCLLSGDSDIHSGKAFLNDREITMTGGRKSMVNYGIGYVEYYKKSLFPKLSVIENLTVAGLDNFKKTTGINKNLNKFIANEYTEKLGLTVEDLKRPLYKVDNRNQMNIALYKWLIAKVKLIIMDNVFSGTDVILHNCIHEFLKEAKKNNVGIIYTSPNIQEAMELCDRVYVLSNKVIEREITDLYKKRINKEQKEIVQNASIY